MSESQENVIQFQKGHLVYLRAWVDVPVIKSQNRHRNEFIGMIQPLCDEIEKERLEILDQYAKKDSDGKVLMENGQVAFENAEDSKLAQVAYEELLEEPVNLTVTKPKAVEFAKGFLAKIDRKFGYAEGTAYDEVCDALGITVEDGETDTKSSLEKTGFVKA